MTLQAAVLARTLARRRVPLRVGVYEASLGPPPAEIADPVRFTARLGDGAAAVTAPRRLLASVLAALDPAAPNAPPDVAALLLELALEPELMRLGAAGLAFAFGDGAAEKAAPDETLSIGFACRVGNLEDVLRLDLDMAGAPQVARLLDRLPPRRSPLPHIPVTLGIQALATTLLFGQLRRLRLGDVVLADALSEGQVLLVAGERLAWRCRRERSMVQVVSERVLARAAGLEGWVMEDATGPGEPVDDAGLEELPIRMTFELGRLEVPLGELETLGPGHVFELGRDPEQAVDLVANGRRIGRGRLVDVAGAIGVQVTRIGRDG